MIHSKWRKHDFIRVYNIKWLWSTLQLKLLKKHMKVVFKIFRLCRQLSFIPEDVWDQRNSRKELVMVAAIIYQKNGLFLQRRVARPPTQLLALIETIRNEDLQQLSTEKCFRFRFSTVTVHFPLDETWVKIFYRRPRVFLEFCCLIWLPVATCQLAL